MVLPRASFWSAASFQSITRCPAKRTPAPMANARISLMVSQYGVSGVGTFIIAPSDRGE